MIEINCLDHVAISVKDMDVSIRWYTDVLGLRKKQENAWGPYPVMMLAHKSDSGIALFPSQSGNPFPMPPNRHTATPHIAFNVDLKDFSEIQKDLNNKGIAFVFQDHTTHHSIYLRDPDDYCIELTTLII